MRYIDKNQPKSKEFWEVLRELFETKPTKQANKVKRKWKKWKQEDGGSKKKKFSKLLLIEQYYLCCYSEIRLYDEDDEDKEHKWGYHIEHVENKKQNPARTFDYNNLLVSAFADGSELADKDKPNIFGGHADGKTQSVDMSLFISPLEKDCSRFFTYQSNGRVAAHSQLGLDEKERADYTIKLLNLNSPELITRRQNLWNELEKELFEYYHDDDKFTCWIESELLPYREKPTECYKLKSFFSLRRCFFKESGESILAGYNNGELL